MKFGHLFLSIFEIRLNYEPSFFNFLNTAVSEIKSYPSIITVSKIGAPKSVIIFYHWLIGQSRFPIASVDMCDDGMVSWFVGG